jgi:hypothetical protein
MKSRHILHALVLATLLPTLALAAVKEAVLQVKGMVCPS